MTNGTTSTNEPEVYVFPKNYNEKTSKFKLVHPFNAGGRDIKEPTLKRFKIKDMDEFKQLDDEYETTKAMVQKSTELTPEEVAEMDVQDFDAISEIISTFL